ncbi:hypothetical protein Ahy_A06g026421 [Arachis hypogaea]|uniref:Uncharacterized protein n=1 Tax=Arachis hypogaea TaxID=3818 RepID=A0A445CKE4_ARAHY|nr:hypothetical protein Ahy_A06g026421 [Arachis hypogaea]
MQDVTVSLTSSVIEDLLKDDYVYEVSNEDPAKEQEQQAQEPTVQQEAEEEAPVNVPLEQPCKEPIEQQSKQEAPLDVCPPKPNKQGVTGSITSSIIEHAAQPREREDERPSFSLGINPPASQPTQPSEESDSQLEILAEAVIEARVEAALKFSEGTSSEPTLPTAQVYKTPQKKTKITNELIDKGYHWMTHEKQTKDDTNEYEPLFVLKHEGLYEGLREYFMSLKPEEQVHATNFIMGIYDDKYYDKSTKKSLIISHMRMYAGAEPLIEDALGEEAEYISLNGQRDRFPQKVDYRKLNEEDKAIFDSLKCVTLVTLTKSFLNMSIEGEENWQKFCRTFVVFIQKCFLLRTTVSMASAIHKPPIFCVDNIQQWDWACHVLSFLRKGIKNKRKGKKQSVEGCVFVLMLIYFHETKYPHLDGLDAPPAPWVAYWTKKMILERISKEATDTRGVHELGETGFDVTQTRPKIYIGPIC